MNAIGRKVDRCAEAIKYREGTFRGVARGPTGTGHSHILDCAASRPRGASVREPGWDGLLGGKGVVVSPTRVASGHHARAHDNGTS